MSIQKMKTSGYVARAADLVNRYDLAKASLRGARRDLASAEEAYYASEEAQQIVQVLAETVQEEAHHRIAGVVSRCLVTVFDTPYEFNITFERARGRTEARLAFVRDGVTVSPMDAAGGGVVDVAAFALRLSCLMLSRPPKRRVVVMDEPFKFVSAEYRPAVRTMLEDLATELGVQFIMVTHIEELQCGTVVDVV